MNQILIESVMRICLYERHVRNGHRQQLRTLARMLIGQLRRLRDLAADPAPAAHA